MRPTGHDKRGKPPRALTATAAIRDVRGPRQPVDTDRPLGVFDEIETASAGVGIPTRVMILTGAECRFTCSMCDLWRHALSGPTPAGALPTQIQQGLAVPTQSGEPLRWIKLYNGSNFFDSRSVPVSDLPAIAQLVAPFERVVVENHPRLLGDTAVRFRDQLNGRLEVAMGLETVHPEAVASLNKQMSLDDFQAACGWLRREGVDARAFVLLGTPGVPPEEAVAWCLRSIAFAIRCGVRHVSIVPLRTGNGWVDRLIAEGRLSLPTAGDLEAAAANAFALPRPAGRVITTDLWDFDRLAGSCEACRGPRRERIALMSRAQAVASMPALSCGCSQ
jgi:radical SAM enzyme (TIGR01210 family)